MKRWLALILLVPAALALVVVPVYLIQPFKAQTPRALEVGYEIKRLAPWATILLTLAGLALVVLIWRRSRRRWAKALAVVLLVPVAASAWLARQNVYEVMFNPLADASFAPADRVDYVNGDDMVLAVEHGGERAAYPVRLMAYHHVVGDIVGGVPLVATYWTLCHTGLVWETTVDGRVLHFHLAGINNQNFIMRDEETGSWWQQVTGECVLGPLKGRRLAPADFDELTFDEWRREGPAGRVLRPDPRVQAAGRYEPADWEQRMQRVRVATTLADPNAVLPARTLVVGVEAGGASKAYPFEALRKQNPVVDTLGGTPLLILLAEDGKSVRVFDRRLDGRALEFFRREDSPALIDAETGSAWDFTGVATSGALAGRRLEKLPSLKDYWFDWRAYHPDAGVYLH